MYFQEKSMLLQKSQLITQNTTEATTLVFFFCGLCILDLVLKQDVNSDVMLFRALREYPI